MLGKSLRSILGRGAKAMTATAAVLALAGALLVAAPAQQSAQAANGADFRPGNIISDAVFYDSGSMSADQIQSFLNTRRPSCDAGYTCLKSYRESFSSRSGDARCAGIPGQTLSAAAILHAVGRACGINPQVLLVLLEKEQGLVTDASPAARQYRSATGFACPDTAPCDAQYYGFFNQVYSAARQYRVYQATASQWRYQAGRTNTILYNPDSSCGSSPVYIENQATAGLYIYTPYQPNSAALGNMYGVGDRCSAYGNRNFWRLFTDWFGSTQGGGSGDFVRTASDERIWLISGSYRYHVPNGDVLSALSKLGSHRIVSSDYLSGFRVGPDASELVRDPASGEISLVQEGTRHRFASCDLVGFYGFSCDRAMNLTAGQLAKFPRSGEVTRYFRLPGAPDVYTVRTDGTKAAFTTASALVAHAGAWPSYMAVMRSSVADRFRTSRPLMTPATLVKSASRPQVYLVDGWDRKVPVNSFATARELGISGYTVESTDVVDAYPTASEALSIGIRCDDRTNVAAGGRRLPVADASAYTLRVSPLSASTCSRIPVGQTIAGTVFLKAADSSTVFALRDGQLRRLDSYAALLWLNGGRPATIATVSAETLAAIPSGAAVIAPGTLVRATDDARVYLIDGGDRKVPVDTFARPAEFGVRGYSTVEPAALANYESASESVSSIWRCEGGPSYFGASGTLYRLTSSADPGLRVTSLRADTCAGLKVSSTAPLSRLFVKAEGQSTVYSIENGKRRPASSWSALVSRNGGSAPTILTMSRDGLAVIPAGSEF